MADGAYMPLRAQLGNRTKVAIVGFCESSRALTPYNDPDFEIWGLNRGALFMGRADRWFEMHGEHIVTMQNRRPGKHVEWLDAFPGPVYMHKKYDFVRNSIAYPLKEMADFFGPNIYRIGHVIKIAGKQTASGGPAEMLVVDGQEDKRDTTGEPYLTSSIAYEIALAIYEGFEEIHLYGVDLNTEAEYAWQKPGVEFLLGWAAGHGIKVVLPENCPLLRGGLYGRGYMSEMPEQMTYDQLNQRLDSLQKDFQRVQVAIAQWTGARAELVDFTQAQIVPGIQHEKLEGRRKEMEAQIAKLQFQANQIQGSIQETAYWVHQTMGGQDPKEAINQLKEIKKRELVVEGPITDLEEMQHADATPKDFWLQAQSDGRVDVESGAEFKLVAPI